MLYGSNDFTCLFILFGQHNILAFHYISDVGTIKDFVQNFGHRLIVCIYIYGAAHVHTFLIVDKQILGLSLDFIEDFAYS